MIIPAARSICDFFILRTAKSPVEIRIEHPLLFVTSLFSLWPIHSFASLFFLSLCVELLVFYDSRIIYLLSSCSKFPISTLSC